MRTRPPPSGSSPHRTEDEACATNLRKKKFGKRRGSAKENRKGYRYLRRSCQLFFRIGIGRVRRDDMADPSQGSATAYPKTRRNDQPEDGTQELAIVDLPHSRDKETQDSCGARVSHHCVLITPRGNFIQVLRKAEPHESYSGTVPKVNRKSQQVTRVEKVCREFYTACVCRSLVRPQRNICRYTTSLPRFFVHRALYSGNGFKLLATSFHVRLAMIILFEASA